jgi:hypothetical protein
MDHKKELNTCWLESLIVWLCLEDKTLYQAGATLSLLDTPIILNAPITKVAEWFVDRDISTYDDIRHITWSSKEKDWE